MTMKKIRFLLLAVCVSAGLATFSHVKASDHQKYPLCVYSPDMVCFGIPDEGGDPGWYIDHEQY